MLAELEKQLSTFDPTIHEAVTINLKEMRFLIDELRELKRLRERAAGERLVNILTEKTR